ncbi:MAG: class I SAM-dependent methyltransferase [Rubripirellula sp.]
MNQPPNWPSKNPPARSGKNYGLSGSVARWRRPIGVAEGTWDYVTDRSIADHYDAFVADTPLCRVDESILREIHPEIKKDSAQASEAADSTQKPLIFDFGCGTGRAAFPLALRGYEVLGIDLSQEMLRVIQAKQSAPCSPKIGTLRANLVQLECLASDTADHGICLFSTLGMIQNRRHRRTFLRHANRIIKPGGGLLIHVHNRWAALREYRGIRALLKSWLNATREKDSEFGDTCYAYRGLEKMFMHRFSKRELRADLDATGWDVNRQWRISIDGSSMAHPAAIAGGFFIHATATRLK